MCIRRFLLLGISAITLVACSQSDDTPTPASGTTTGPILNGIFIDSPVAGLSYETASLKGKTNSKGTYEYRKAETISFYIGNMLLGTAPGSPLTTPLSLVPGAIDEKNNKVSNIIRILLTLDTDKNPSNGITISPATADATKENSFDLNAQDLSINPALLAYLASLPDAPKLVDAVTAQEHFANSLREQSLWGSMVWGGGTWQAAVESDTQ